MPAARCPAPNVVDPRGYSTVTERLLFTLSQGFCYAPACRVPVVSRTPDGDTVSVYIAHIRAAKENGPRHDSHMTNEERRSFTNLVLLCKAHHEQVDLHPDDYPAEELQRWKVDREAPLGASMAGLSQLTEDRLAEQITVAIDAVAARAHAGVAELATVNAEAAALLRGLLDKALRIPVLDEVTVAALASAADRLGHLPDSAPMLDQAAQRLRHLEDTSWMLHQTARDLDRLPDATYMLSDASLQLRHLPEFTRMLSGVAVQLHDLPDAARKLAASAELLSDLPQAAERLEKAALHMAYPPQHSSTSSGLTTGRWSPIAAFTCGVLLSAFIAATGLVVAWAIHL